MRHNVALFRDGVPAQAWADLAGPVDHGPGVVVFDENGETESISGAAERWISELVEDPPPSTPSESKTVQAIAAPAWPSRALTSLIADSDHQLTASWMGRHVDEPRIEKSRRPALCLGEIHLLGQLFR